VAYRFKRKERVSKAVRRLACERLAHAIECLHESDRPRAIHCARKDIKKTRAVLRLVRDQITKKERRRLTALIHEAARCLSAPRDALVKAQTVQHLTRHFKGQLAPGALRHLRTQLRRETEEAMKRFAKEKASRAVARTLRRAINRLERLEVRGDGWKAISPGVTTAYRQGRRAYQIALRDPTPENFHAWRKRAKDLWYHVRLLHPVWREQMEAMAGELDKLGENLGDDHDLLVLRQHIKKRLRDHALESETLLGLIVQRQGELRAAALAIGARFYDEKPAVFCERLAGYWHTWRRERKQTPTSAIAAA